MVTWGSAAFEEFESNTTLEELVTTFETSKGWTVKKEVEVNALFFVVNRAGTRFLATADNGGKVRYLYCCSCSDCSDSAMATCNSHHALCFAS